MRHFLRHPTTIPISIQASGMDFEEQYTLKDLGEGGLACLLKTLPDIGGIVIVYISAVQPPYNGKGKVVWTKPAGKLYEVGIQFIDHDEEFKMRMVEQVCQIEDYKQRMLIEEGRDLDTETAAKEWIDKYAADFGK